MIIRNPSEDEEDAMLFAADPVLMARAHEIIRILSADPDDVEEEEEEAAPRVKKEEVKKEKKSKRKAASEEASDVEMDEQPTQTAKATRRSTRRG